MAIMPRNSFDLQAVALHLARILEDDVPSCHRITDARRGALPKFKGVAAWLDEFLYIVIEVETPKGTALTGFETLFYPEGTFGADSVEFENALDLWQYELAGIFYAEELDYADPTRINWFKTQPGKLLPNTLDELKAISNKRPQVWVRP
ncbi:hypothetical protein [Corynebacterium sp.]|uniref:hypothetical protein n=1 Tax=Corynebacterium sp. TaxID=1720 RepID=UPI0026DA958D|nr:hypothetical protein [Corynebacterium sp.]MDO5033192.1 hypothetical protein [Corynebacterium sp.]